MRLCKSTLVSSVANTRPVCRLSACGLVVVLCSMGLLVSAGCNAAGDDGGGGSNPTDRAAARSLPRADATGADKAFALTEFAVDVAHQNPYDPDPHEVFRPDFDNFQLTIVGEFDEVLCYMVWIERTGSSSCGSANNSGSDQAEIRDANTLFVNISPQGQADFADGDDWDIVVRARSKIM